MCVDWSGVNALCSLFGVEHNERNYSLGWTMIGFGILSILCAVIEQRHGWHGM